MKIKEIKALILDMDGVLWKGDQPIGNLAYTFKLIEASGWKFSLVTNNATRTISQYAHKLNGFGVDVKVEQIINSSVAAGYYLQKRFPGGGNIYVIGESGLVNTLAEYGFIHDDQNVLAVVAGMDRQLTYDKLARATQLIRSGAHFVATNPDKTFPTPEGLVPGAGAILASIQAATDTDPVIVGKPSPRMYQIALMRMNVHQANTLVIGDRLETDIAAGQELGCMTALLLSGVTRKDQVSQWSPPPDIVAADISTLIHEITEKRHN